MGLETSSKYIAHHILSICWLTEDLTSCDRWKKCDKTWKSMFLSEEVEQRWNKKKQERAPNFFFASIILYNKTMSFCDVVIHCWSHNDKENSNSIPSKTREQFWKDSSFHQKSASSTSTSPHFASSKKSKQKSLAASISSDESSDGNSEDEQENSILLQSIGNLSKLHQKVQNVQKPLESPELLLRAHMRNDSKKIFNFGASPASSSAYIVFKKKLKLLGAHALSNSNAKEIFFDCQKAKTDKVALGKTHTLVLLGSFFLWMNHSNIIWPNFSFFFFSKKLKKTKCFLVLDLILTANWDSQITVFSVIYAQ